MFKPMLAKAADPAKMPPYPFAAQAKLDGIRASVVDGQLVSRTLKPIPNNEIYKALSRPELEGLDGELIVGEPTSDDCYRRTASFVMASDKTGEPWTYHVFDFWLEPGLNWMQRMIRAANAVAASPTAEKMLLVPFTPVITPDELDAVEAKAIKQGHEGLILRTDGPYKFGRSGVRGPLLKLKRFEDFEAEIVGVYEELHNANEATVNALGRTERSSHKANKTGKGTLGGLVLRAINGPAEGVEFKCGTGFDAAQRADLWHQWHDDAASLKGAVVKVKSFPVGVKDKPRHPVFVGFRDMYIDG